MPTPHQRTKKSGALRRIISAVSPSKSADGSTESKQSPAKAAPPTRTPATPSANQNRLAKPTSTITKAPAPKKSPAKKQAPAPKATAITTRVAPKKSVTKKRAK